jgi:uncharacterized membrane protein
MNSKITRGASLLFAGLFAGFLVAVLVLELSLRKFEASVYAQVRLVELDSLDKLAVATLLPAMIATIAVIVPAVRARTRIPRLPLTALVLLVLVFAVTLAVNLPINADQLSWNVQAPPADWASRRDQWQLAHALRTAAALAAFGCLTWNALTGSPATARSPRSGALVS